MSIQRFRFSCLAACLLLGVASISTAAAADVEAAHYRSLLEEKSAAIVTVKAVLQMEIRMMGQTQQDEQRVEVSGAIVDPSGLVLVSNADFSADRMMRMFGGAMAPGLSIDVTPTDMRVVIEGDEEQEFDAFIVATDADLDLAFIQIEELGDHELTVINLGDSAGIDIGERVLSLSRLGRGFDYAAHVESGRISGSIRRPRRAWTMDGAIHGMGLPIFDVNGQVVGVLTTLVSDDETQSGSMGMMRMMTGAAPMQTFAVPPRVVRALMQTALDRAAEMLEERGAGEATDDSDENGDDQDPL